MDGMIEQKCKNCGAPLEPDLTCSYCGTRYVRKKGEEPRRTNKTPPCHVVEAVVDVPLYDIASGFFGEDERRELVKGELVEKLVRNVIGMVDVNAHVNEFKDEIRYSARLRIVDPAYRFKEEK